MLTNYSHYDSHLNGTSIYHANKQSGCTSLLLHGLPKLPEQAEKYCRDNLDNLGTDTEIQGEIAL